MFQLYYDAGHDDAKGHNENHLGRNHAVTAWCYIRPASSPICLDQIAMLTNALCNQSHLFHSAMATREKEVHNRRHFEQNATPGHDWHCWGYFESQSLLHAGCQQGPMC